MRSSWRGSRPSWSVPPSDLQMGDPARPSGPVSPTPVPQQCELQRKLDRAVRCQPAGLCCARSPSTAVSEPVCGNRCGCGDCQYRRPSPDLLGQRMRSAEGSDVRRGEGACGADPCASPPTFPRDGEGHCCHHSAERAVPAGAGHRIAADEPYGGEHTGWCLRHQVLGLHRSNFTAGRWSPIAEL